MGFSRCGSQCMYLHMSRVSVRCCCCKAMLGRVACERARVLTHNSVTRGSTANTRGFVHPSPPARLQQK